MWLKLYNVPGSLKGREGHASTPAVSFIWNVDSVDNLSVDKHAATSPSFLSNVLPNLSPSSSSVTHLNHGANDKNTNLQQTTGLALQQHDVEVEIDRKKKIALIRGPKLDQLLLEVKKGDDVVKAWAKKAAEFNAEGDMA
ncbi:hypothetical protein BT69DRAFT_1299545 [Atractiella rhizophila]|nr:hypothetical protein BT69DRAFT_1299545 [Atractiella rhizophila]